MGSVTSKLTGMFRSLFKPRQGGAAKTRVETVEYKGYTIEPASFQDGAQWVTAAKISKTEAGETRQHDFIRADFFPTQEGADEFAVVRAKRVIDEQGDGLFLGD